MDILTIILIGIGLAMDCLAVSISKGICAKKFKWKYVFRMAFLFGIFQAVMPLISFAAGMGFSTIIKDYDHWIAFGLLAFIGGKMFIEGLKPIAPDCETDKHPFRWKSLMILAIATSIDALATGIIFIPFPDQIFILVGIIGIISFIFSFSGVIIGIKVHKHLKFNVELLGGIILVGIGIKILVEHLFLY
jgi:putative Mn2+ efflux pump MntP